MIKKYNIKDLSIEITRKCNLECIHCCRGEAQNLTITPEIINKFFSEVNIVDKITIIGGETLLELDMLQYLVNSINKYHLCTSKIGLITNGYILDKRLIEIFTTFVNQNDSRTASIIISDDRFHNIEQSNLAFKYYNSLPYDRTKITINKFSYFKENVDNMNLLYSGRAKEYIDNNFNKIKKEKKKNNTYVNIIENSIRTHQICIENNTVQCSIQLSANGLVGLSFNGDYITSDKLAFGNILDKPLFDILTKHNQSCCYLCDECFHEILITNEKMFHNIEKPIKHEIYNLIHSVNFKRVEIIWKIRQLAKDKFPELPMEEIIINTPIYSIEEFRTLLDNILLKMNKRNNAYNIIQNYMHFYKEQFPNVKDSELQELVFYKYALNLLNDVLMDKENIVYPFMSTKKLMKSKLFRKFSRIEKEYLVKRKHTPPIINVGQTMTDSKKYIEISKTRLNQFFTKQMNINAER